MVMDYILGEDFHRPIAVDGLKLDHRLVRVPGFQGKHPFCEKKSMKEPGSLVIAGGIFPQWDDRDDDDDIANIDDNQKYSGYSKLQMQVWKESCRKIHASGSFVFVQLFSIDKLGGQEFSETRNGEGLVDNFVNSLTREEIQLYIDAYVRAAKTSLMFGADGVELHGAAGYLLDGFLNAKTNRRADEYGGSIANRAKFILEVVDAIVKAIGSSRISICLSPSEKHISLVTQYSYLLGQLEKRAVWGQRLAYIHLEESPVDLEEDQIRPFGGSHSFVYSIWRGIVIRGHSELTDELKKCDQTLIAYERSSGRERYQKSSSRFNSRTPLEYSKHAQCASTGY
ncbi:hypothetical protein ZYGR_0AD04030 [Zygosaccharomyces rouxii]|uniref:ZYRO0G15444p n=2 Tax=Zygosaccharomyces rouxii TaxID=4956 RepID=C5E0T5_ZYGRC|nr:uncharacterized protein ZYRO0G15444g [Zygosaccharomyces rouxii]KAH9202713.1 NADH oxidase family-domain-containing protein [Zygosaccharomyces rouxii]GAV51220.1 hypothetical protein ZYGR_0AD04030 [Zygosaccharomyces rouxii]CAR29719.1 ZYRO0G15444p [Zygosaccharomyces rouxii]